MTSHSEQVPSNQRDVSASEPTSYVVEGNTYRELIAERDQLRVHLRQKSEQITRLQDGIEKMQQGSAESGASQPPNDGWSALCEAVAKADPVNYRSPTHEPPADPNPLDPTNHYFRKCLKGHVAYSVSFPECPSCKIERERAAQPPLLARPLNEWHEDMGDVVWWKFPVDEPAWIGSPLASDWPGYHTHWTPHPAVPEAIRYSTATKSEGQS